VAEREKRLPADALAVAIGLAALLMVLALIAIGWRRAHWLPVAGFLVVAVTGAGYEAATHRLARRRARRFGAAIPWNVPLARPRWLLDTFWFGWAGAALGAVASAVGFPGVGLGLALALGAFTVFGMSMFHRLYPSRLTFESLGLRVGGKRFSLLVPWRAITEVQAMGKNSIRLHLAASASHAAAVEPDTPRNRELREALLLSWGNETILMLAEWAGGLDAATLGRAIEAARGGVREQPN
jgi:hypothetical protein